MLALPFRKSAVTAAITLLGTWGSGVANAAFVLGPFSVTQQVEVTAARNGSVVGSSGPLFLGQAAPAVTSVALATLSNDANAQSAFSAFVPDGNRAFSVSASGSGDEGTAQTLMGYDFVFTNTSANTFTGSIAFLVWDFQLSNQCLVSYGCSDTDPSAVAGLDIDITTTRPGNNVTVQSLQVELGTGGNLSVLDDDFGVASAIQPFSVGALQFHGLVSSPVRLRVNLGSVAPNESVTINYDTRTYTESTDGTCQPPPKEVSESVCIRFEDRPIAGSGGSGGGTVRVCVQFETQTRLIPQAPEQCTVRRAFLRDPLDNQSSDGLSIATDDGRVPVPSTLALLGAGLIAGSAWRRRSRR